MAVAQRAPPSTVATLTSVTPVSVKATATGALPGTSRTSPNNRVTASGPGWGRGTTGGGGGSLSAGTGGRNGLPLRLRRTPNSLPYM